MPLTKKRRYEILRWLDEKYQDMLSKHYENAPKSNTIPVGGGDWMDTFFRSEGLRGCIGALRRGLCLKESFEEGKMVSEIAVRVWNGKREWQVHRWDKTVHNYLDGVRREIARCRFKTVK